MAANVNKPTDTKQRDEDINRKLQIYGIFSAFKNGKVPSVCDKTRIIAQFKLLQIH